MLDSAKPSLILNEDKLQREEEWDGCYTIMTSEHQYPINELLNYADGQWRSEQSFKVTKSDLESRPVYLSRQEHIAVLFLTKLLSSKSIDNIFAFLVSFNYI
ncbi:hypothetical protein [Oceanobacillus caeni]|uniref:Transposase IS4-like domain-containing protein n=1 Tax=Oceanobacillus caeni TaxID=405946 RepID=A0ABR5MKW2_9BACI|nr:hypothetical protein [Oceanobacillus caeni]KPH76486.1 hypothetical protein AFL42_05935 [Oceanobacillus caeni]